MLVSEKYVDTLKSFFTFYHYLFYFVALVSYVLFASSSSYKIIVCSSALWQDLMATLLKSGGYFTHIATFSKLINDLAFIFCRFLSSNKLEALPQGIFSNNGRLGYL